MDQRGTRIRELLHEAAETHHRIFRGRTTTPASWCGTSAQADPGPLGGWVSMDAAAR